ncbi:MAG: UDP-N-acetyl-D-glucosamine 2-epimerase, UDP-hydrolyzing [Patescibacteria group bacterium]|nr:UDP-N-acetyl-D-glucosamine 2-epimerase, UDP-hydrolyzing [Patescibacteria group bacterium]
MRKVCFVITSFIHYSRNLLVLEELRKRKDVELHIVVGGSALLSKYSSKFAHIKDLLKKDGHTRLYEVYFSLEGNDLATKAKTAGLGIIEFTTLFNNIKPDVVVVRGDRFEVLSATIAAAYMSLPVAHIEGGDLSGSIDESVRHAITKFSHIHFATNAPAKERILRLGEHPNYVFNFGSPDIEVVDKLSKKSKKIDLKKTGSGASFDLKDGYMMVMFHPDINDVKKIHTYTKNILKAVHEIGLPTLWFWPNFDAGAEDLSQELRLFKDEVKGHKIRFMRYLGPREFVWLLNNTKCLIGNSSAGVKECSFLGVPVVNVGKRQNGRLKAENVVSVDFDPKKIKKAIENQLKAKRFKSSQLYFAKNTSKNIADTIATVPLYTQKIFID